MLIFNAVGLQIRQNITKSALHLLPKHPALIAEAPRAYFGSALRLFWRRGALRVILLGQDVELGARGEVRAVLAADGREAEVAGTLRLAEQNLLLLR